MSKEYIKQLEETVERMKKEMENLHAEKDAIEEKWKNHEIYDDSEMWSLDKTLASIILPRLIRLKEVKNGYPSELQDKYEWDAIMDKMIRAFEIIDESEDYPSGYHKESQVEVDDGLALFAKYFQGLWD